MISDTTFAKFGMMEYPVRYAVAIGYVIALFWIISNYGWYVLGAFVFWMNFGESIKKEVKAFLKAQIQNIMK